MNTAQATDMMALAVYISKTREGSKLHYARLADMVAELYRLARRHARLQEASCNGDLTMRQAMAEARTEERIRTLCWSLDVGVKFQGDPRGYTVKVLTPGTSNGWESDVWGVG